MNRATHRPAREMPRKRYRPSTSQRESIGRDEGLGAHHLGRQADTILCAGLLKALKSIGRLQSEDYSVTLEPGRREGQWHGTVDMPASHRMPGEAVLREEGKVRDIEQVAKSEEMLESWYSLATVTDQTCREINNGDMCLERAVDPESGEPTNLRSGCQAVLTAALRDAVPRIDPAKGLTKKDAIKLAGVIAGDLRVLYDQLRTSDMAAFTTARNRLRVRIEKATKPEAKAALQEREAILEKGYEIIRKREPAILRSKANNTGEGCLEQALGRLIEKEAAIGQGDGKTRSAADQSPPSTSERSAG